MNINIYIYVCFNCHNFHFSKIGNAYLQAALGLQVLFLAILAHMTYRPYKEHILNQVETCSLAISILCLSCGSLLFSDTTPKDLKNLAIMFIFTSFYLFILYILDKLIISYQKENEENDVTMFTKFLQMIGLRKKKKIVKSNETDNDINLKTNAMYKKKIKIKKIIDDKDEDDIDGLELSISNEINRKL